jgi:hypothetical protein
MPAAAELHHGASRSRRPGQNLAALGDPLAVAPPIAFGREGARAADGIAAALCAAGMRIGPFDTLIAARRIGSGLGQGTPGCAARAMMASFKADRRDGLTGPVRAGPGRSRRSGRARTPRSGCA